MKNRNVDYTKKYNDQEKVEQQEEFEIIDNRPVEEEIVELKATVDIDAHQTLNLREGMSSDSEIITTIPSGKIVVVNENGQDWCQVITESGATGYVMTKYLKFI